MYRMIKTHKESNAARIITSGSGTAVEKLSIFVEKYLFPEIMKIDTRMRDTPHMLNKIDDLYRNGNLHENCLLVSFAVLNMFPSIDNKMRIESVKNIFLNRDDNIPPAECIIEALELCLNCKNSNFNKQHYLQVYDTAQGLHRPCLYSDDAIYSYDLKALSCAPTVKCWERVCDDMFVLWEHSRDDLDNFSNFVNSINLFKKIHFTISCPTDNVLEFLDLILLFDVTFKQILVDVFSKPTNSFTYLMPSTYFPKRNIKKVSEGVAVRLR